MSIARDLTPHEVAQELIRLAGNRPTSGNLRSLNQALDAYRNRSKLLDAELIRFDLATNRYIDRVQRGYAGTPEWTVLRDAATKIAPALEIVSEVTARGDEQVSQA